MQTPFRFSNREALPSLPPNIDPGKYIHSPVHHAVACKDYVRLRRIIAALPKPSGSTSVLTESVAIEEERKAEILSGVIDRRDVPLRETPLHLAVRWGDITAVEILMSAGADCSLQNEQGWSSLQEAICTRQEAIAKVILKYYQRLAWAKWCRRLPRIVATMRRMRDFYMEVSFNFESSVIPLIAKAAPSDTYRIWKRGPNLRADMTIAGIDGFKIQRSGQTFLFFGEGSEDEKLPAGSLCVLDHKNKEVTNVLEGAGNELTDSEIAEEVSEMMQTNLYRPGIDVTQAVLVPQLSWMWQEKVEYVHGWKAKVYDMHNVMVSMKSRGVPGAITYEELFLTPPNVDGEEHGMREHSLHMRMEEEKKRRGKASTSQSVQEDGDRKHRAKTQYANVKDDFPRVRPGASSPPISDDRKGWFGRHRKGSSPRSSLEDDGEGSRYQKARRSTDAELSGNRDVEEAFLFLNDTRKTRDKSRVRPSD
eukprot:c23468_g1_i1 orf=3-1433(-)